MRREEQIQGTAFTRRKTVHHKTETAEEFEAALKDLSTFSHDPWEAQRAILQAIREDLLREAAAHAPGHRFEPRVDAGWYLREMDMFGQMADSNIAKGDARWAAYAGLQFGSLYAEFQLKLAREEIFLTGKKIVDARAKTRDDANELRQMRAAAAWANWNKAAAVVRARHPGWKISGIARQVKSDLKLRESVETIRKRLNKNGEAG